MCVFCPPFFSKCSSMFPISSTVKTFEDLGEKQICFLLFVEIALGKGKKPQKSEIIPLMALLQESLSCHNLKVFPKGGRQKFPKGEKGSTDSIHPPSFCLSNRYSNKSLKGLISETPIQVV